MNHAPAATLQRAFAAALLDPAQPLPPSLRAWNGSDPGVRFDVHRNNVVASLVAALAETFPVVRQQVGADFFAALAGVYVREQPPPSPLLSDYGDGFGDWLARFDPLHALPWLADLARLERARVRACHAADATALDPATMAARLAEPQHLPQARLALQASLQVLVSPFAVVSLWTALQTAAAVPGIDIDRPEAALVLRDAGDDVLVVEVAPAAAVFVARLAAGCTLAEAVDAANAAAAGCPAGFDLAATLSLLIRHGAIVAWPAPGEPP